MFTTKWINAYLALLLLLLTSCISDSSFRRVRPDYWTRQLTTNALTDDTLSEQSKTFFSLRGWEGKELRKTEHILSTLREQLIREPNRVGLIAFAELAYLKGMKEKEPEQKVAYLLTATRAAYAAIFEPSMGTVQDPLDPNLRFSADLYNYALSRLIDVLLDTEAAPRKMNQIRMIEGNLNITRGEGLSDSSALAQTFVAFSYKTNALRRHNRRRGLGVPLVALQHRQPIIEGREQLHPPVRETEISPATVILQFQESWSHSEQINATAKLLNPLSVTHVTISGEQIPLEADTSLSLALLYNNQAKYRGLMNMPRFLRGDFMVENRGLYLLEPYSTEKIPVVFTHGLMDSPLTWVPMLNALISDPVLKERYQFWVFFYPTSTPMLQSASELRQSLLSLHAEMSADQQEWDNMVLVGHSMGGIITRLLITDSTDHFDPIRTRTNNMAEGDPKLQEYLELVTVFKPLPFVRRAIFMGAPHRGADMAKHVAGRAGSALMSQPEYMRRFVDAEEGRKKRLKKMENGIDNLSPKSLFSIALGESDLDPEIPAHSIIGDMWHAGSTNGTDSLVAYWSSHVDGVESEKVVHADHMTIHKKIPAITEVRRILLKHLSE